MGARTPRESLGHCAFPGVVFWLGIDTRTRLSRTNMRQPSQARVHPLQGVRKIIEREQLVQITYQNHGVTATREINSGTAVLVAEPDQLLSFLH